MAAIQPKPWKLVTSATAYANRWIQVDVDQVELPDGSRYDYTVVRRHQHGAAVWAVDDQGRVLLEQEYRYPVDAIIWQLPGGLIDAGESPLQAVRRELAEETGHTAGRWRQLGTFWDNPAFEDMLVHLFLAEDVTPNGGDKHDPAEFIRHAWKTMEWVKEQVRSGEIRDRVVLAALGYLWAEGPTNT